MVYFCPGYDSVTWWRWQWIKKYDSTHCIIQAKQPYKYVYNMYNIVKSPRAHVRQLDMFGFKPLGIHHFQRWVFFLSLCFSLSVNA